MGRGGGGGAKEGAWKGFRMEWRDRLRSDRRRVSLLFDGSARVGLLSPSAKRVNLSRS